MIVGTHSDTIATDNWLYVGKPFLISTVALGGATNVLPVVFQRVRFQAKTLKFFIASIWSAMAIIYLLNVMWCYYILRIVPQTGDGISLQNAEELGQIATIPLIEYIGENFPQYLWISYLVKFFITISISVSYIAASSGFKHYGRIGNFLHQRN